jgi:hypothetical protein
MSEQVDMEEEDRNSSMANTANQTGEKKRFEVKKVISSKLKGYI